MSNTTKHFVNTKQNLLLLNLKHLVFHFQQNAAYPLKTQVYTFLTELLGSPAYPAQPAFYFCQTQLPQPNIVYNLKIEKPTFTFLITMYYKPRKYSKNPRLLFQT